MTANRRIFWNTIATYGRSLYALVCGLFTARWVLMTLGEVDYGLIGVVGGMTGFISFINGLLSSAVSRFYAYAVGQANSAVDAEFGIDECRRWFNVAVFIHTLIPTILMIIGYPIGEWAVRNYLTISPERVEACVWVFRLSCLTCFIGMASVPYQSLYQAHQEIAELTIYGFVSTTLNVIFLCYMVSHVRDWFLTYAVWMCLIANVPSLIITMRAFSKYKEARIMPKYFWDWGRVKKILEFAGGRMLISLAFLLNNEGVAILINKTLGPARNAAMAIGNSVSGHCLTLTGALTGAMQPAITNAAGEGDLEKMRSLAFAACKYTTLAVLIFAVPLSLEIDKVLELWLKNPPECVGLLTVCLLLAAIFDQLTCGHWIAIFAVGKVALFSAVEATVWFTMFPLCMLGIWLGLDVVGVGLAYALTKLLIIVVKLYFGRALAGLSIRHWFFRVLIPIAASTLLAGGVGYFVTTCLQSGFVRIVLTTIVCESILVPVAFMLCLTSSERRVLCAKMPIFNKLRI